MSESLTNTDLLCCLKVERSCDTFCKLKWRKAKKQLLLIYMKKPWAFPNLRNNLLCVSDTLEHILLAKRYNRINQYKAQVFTDTVKSCVCLMAECNSQGKSLAVLLSLHWESAVSVRACLKTNAECDFHFSLFSVKLKISSDFFWLVKTGTNVCLVKSKVQ